MASPMPGPWHQLRTPAVMQRRRNLNGQAAHRAWLRAVREWGKRGEEGGPDPGDDLLGSFGRWGCRGRRRGGGCFGGGDLPWVFVGFRVRIGDWPRSVGFGGVGRAGLDGDDGCHRLSIVGAELVLGLGGGGGLLLLLLVLLVLLLLELLLHLQVVCRFVLCSREMEAWMLLLHVLLGLLLMLLLPLLLLLRSEADLVLLLVAVMLFQGRGFLELELLLLELGLLGLAGCMLLQFRLLGSGFCS